MNTLTFLLRIWTPTGAGPRELPWETSQVLDSGLRARISPEGDGEELSLMARGAGFGVKILEALQLVMLPEAGGEIPLYYGQCRFGGNTSDVDGQNYVFRSLSHRFKHCTLPEDWTAPAQAAHLTVRAAFLAVADQYAGLFLYDEAMFPDLGFDAIEIERGNGQDLHSLLEMIAADGAEMNVKVRFGVNAARQAYCMPARDTVVDLAQWGLVIPTWLPSVAEEPVTVVRWYLQRRLDGGWLKREVEAPEAQALGRWLKRMELDPATGVVRQGIGTYQFDPVRFPDNSQANVDASAFLRDRVGLSPSTTAWLALNDLQFIHLTISGPADTLEVSIFNNGLDAFVLTKQEPGQPEVELWRSLELGFFDRIFAGPFPAGTVFRARGDVQYPRVQVGEMRADYIDMPLLRRISVPHLNLPATDPADLATPAFIPPDQLGGFVTLGEYQSPASAWEYRISVEGGLETAALAGQKDPPEAIAQAELIRARDQDATMNAIQAST